MVCILVLVYQRVIIVRPTSVTSVQCQATNIQWDPLQSVALLCTWRGCQDVVPDGDVQESSLTS